MGVLFETKDGMVAAVVEQKAATPEQLLIREINPGAYAFSGAPFWDHHRRGFTQQCRPRSTI